MQVRAVSAKYIMKCDDDTFVRVDAVIKAVNKVARHKSVYVGNMNYYHKPLRFGKWAVTYEVCLILLTLIVFLVCLCYIFVMSSCDAMTS